MRTSPAKKTPTNLELRPYVKLNGAPTVVGVRLGYVPDQSQVGLSDLELLLGPRLGGKEHSLAAPVGVRARGAGDREHHALAGLPVAFAFAIAFFAAFFALTALALARSSFALAAASIAAGG